MKLFVALCVLQQDRVLLQVRSAEAVAAVGRTCYTVILRRQATKYDYVADMSHELIALGHAKPEKAYIGVSRRFCTRKIYIRK